MQEDTRRHEKYEKLFQRAMKDGDTLGSLRAVRRWSAYNWYDQHRNYTRIFPGVTYAPGLTRAVLQKGHGARQPLR